MDMCTNGKNWGKKVITTQGSKLANISAEKRNEKYPKIPSDYRGMMLYTAYTIPIDIKYRACCDKCFANGPVEVEIYSLHSRKDK